ncbi:hypothetical protein CEUSTIGMA_g9821.t1 [Chlamydomonas eustigma]|uniref:Golgi SNAP receptor complex member 1 n=1 Tax=Chlamydomonas eustigma TaxID=1157962 RepID=A0A250XH68_9CHLO|nr:hypothetical protein CEUSTIGMA_g9821.t1 [Chlamydomonas eustigma]|eukprot:GAX82393.1 hypothetical protein CEUSTIGMA_g9821.t1 [Chlamydomonas eustigma]
MYSVNSFSAGPKHVAMAYMSSPSSKQPSSSVPTRAWEELRREARKLEGELDVRISAYNKLCSGFEASYKLRAENSGMGVEQLSQTKAAEIESLLQRLADLNDEMASALGGNGDSRTHLLARHRDILQDYTQEFRRLSATLNAARDRVQLLGGIDSPHVSLQMQNSSSGALLRERASVQSSTSAVDEILKQASSVSQNLVDQRRLFDSIGDKVLSLGARFPVVNGLLNAIRRKKSKDTIVLACVIAGCVIFTLVYLMFK